MSEPASAVAAGAAMAWKSGALGKLAAIFLTGAVGAGVMAALRPVTARQLFVQGLVAGVVSVYFTESVVDEFSVLSGHTLQVAFLLGAMSWGIVGALVRLQSGRLAVVMEQNPKALLAPRVKVFFSAKSRLPLTQTVVDLSKITDQDRIVGRESAQEWGFEGLDELWTGMELNGRGR